MATHYEHSAELPHGLDREPMHAYPSLGNDSGEQNSQAAQKAEGSSMRRKLRHVSQRIASKLHATDNDPPPLQHQPQQRAPTLAPPSAQDTHELRLAERVAQKPQLPDYKDFLHQPLDTLKSVAQKQGGKEFAEAVVNTDATHGASVKLVLAHERLVEEASGSQQEADAGQEFAGLKKVRQDAFVRWTFARHVRRLKTVPPEPRPQHRRQDFIWSDGQAGEPRMHWAAYGEHVRPLPSLPHSLTNSGPLHSAATHRLHAYPCAQLRRCLLRIARAHRRSPEHELRASPFDIYSLAERRDEGHERSLLGDSLGNGDVCSALFHAVRLQLCDEGDCK